MSNDNENSNWNDNYNWDDHESGLACTWNGNDNYN